MLRGAGEDEHRGTGLRMFNPELGEPRLRTNPATKRLGGGFLCRETPREKGRGRPSPVRDGAVVAPLGRGEETLDESVGVSAIDRFDATDTDDIGPDADDAQ